MSFFLSLLIFPRMTSTWTRPPSPVPASLSRASSGPSSEEVSWLKWCFWSSHQTLSHLHHRQALYSVTPEIRWCTFKANGNFGGEIGTGVCCQSPRLWQREEKHTVDFLIIRNQMALLSASTKFSSFNPVSRNKFLHACCRAASRAWGNPLSVSEFTIAKTNICSCIQRCSSWPSCCLVRDKGSVKMSGTEEWRLCGSPLTQGK